MTRKVNKGTSIVEILLALMIFLILMMPIVSTIRARIQETTNAQEIQYRNEYVQNLMDSVKEVPIDVLKNGNTVSDSYFEKLGYRYTNTAGDVVYPTVTTETVTGSAPYDVYTIYGKTDLGMKNTEYSYAVEISSKLYADMEADPIINYTNPNNLKSAIVDDLDETEVAVISAPFANYDYPAFDALLTKKVEKARDDHEAAAEQDTFDLADSINNTVENTGKRTITIKVSKEGNKYNVKCILTYNDNSLSNADTIEYVPYTQDFDKVPDIYLMYNACIYNGKYAEDQIVYDLSELVPADFEDATDYRSDGGIKSFIIATASEYSDEVEDILGSTETSVLYRTAKDRTTDADILRNNYNVTMTGGAVPHQYLSVYHNLSNDANGMNLNYTLDEFVAVGDLYEAQEARGLYSVKIWMREGDVSVDDLKSKDVTLQGTKGGAELD